MVTGGSPAAMVAAERLGLWREGDPEGEGEGGGHGEPQELTTSTLPWSEMAEEGRRRRNGARRARPTAV